MSVWIQPVYNFVMWSLWMVTFHLQFKPRYPRWMTALLETVIFIPYYWLVTYVVQDFSLLRLFLGEGIVLAMPLLLHRGKWYEIVLVWLSIFLIALFTDIFVYYLGQSTVTPQQLEQRYNYPIWEYLATLVLEIILLTMLNLAAHSLRKKAAWRLRPIELIMLFAYPALQLILLVYWLTVLWNDIARFNAYYIGLAFGVCVASDFVLFLMIRSLVNSSILAAKIETLERESARQDSLYTSLASDYAQGVAMQRAIVAQREHFAALLAEGRKGEALRYADSLTEAAAAKALPACRNRVLASFLQHRMEELQSSGVRTSFSVSLPAEIGISAPELICLFGNLLDNAAEACADVEAPEIVLLCDWRAPYLRVRMENPFAAEKTAHTRRVPELERGVGFLILQNMTERYDGEFRTETDGDRFITSVTWKGETDLADPAL